MIFNASAHAIVRKTGLCLLLVALLYSVEAVLAVPVITTVDTGAGFDVGRYTSLELNGAGNPVISYFDDNTDDLKLAICNDPTCTAPTLLVLDAALAGQYTSLELDVGAAGQPVVSYYNPAAGNLKLAVCSDAVCTTVTVTNVDIVGTVGSFTSLALAGSNPVISYYDTGNSALKLAVCADATCTASTIVSPDTAGAVGQYTSIALNGGNPVISYFDAGNTALKLLVCTNPTCAADTPVTLDNTGNVGAFTSLALTGAGLPVISYYDAGNTALRVIRCTNAACTTSTNTLVDNVANVGTDTSLTLTGGGCPVISYYDVTNTALKVATYSGINCSLVTITTLDNLASVGQYTSIELNAAGNPVISYYDETNGDLKLVTCDTATCALLPTYTSAPIPGSTIALTGGTGSTVSLPLAITNTGAAGSTLDVGLVSITAGYTVTGLQLNDLAQGAAAVNLTVGCTVPQAAGTLVVESNEPGNPQYTYNLTCTLSIPVYSSTPAPNSTIALAGTTGSSASGTIAVSNIGAAGSTLDVSLVSISSGYTIVGLPINALAAGAGAVTLTVSCTVPQAPGTLVVQTNEPGNPQYTYTLTCISTGSATPPPAGGTDTSGEQGGAAQSALQIFDPAISKLGILLPGQIGARGERLEWIVSVQNTGTQAGQNIVITDTLRPELRIDSVTAPGGTARISGQTVTVEYAVLEAGQTLQFSIFTTVQQGVEVDNTACVRAANLAGEECATANAVRSLPATGETPWWSYVLRGSVLMALTSALIVGIWYRFQARS